MSAVANKLRPFSQDLPLCQQLRASMLVHHGTSHVTGLPYDAAALISELYEAAEDAAKELEAVLGAVASGDIPLRNLRSVLAKARGDQ